MIKIPGTGGGDGAFASGGGDSDAGELMGRIRRATREQQTRDKSKCVVVKGSDDRIFVFLFFGGGGRRRFLRRLHFERQKLSFEKTGLTNFCVCVGDF